MIKTLWLFCICFLIVACASVDELIESGQYDQAIKKGLQKLEKTPNDALTKKGVIKAYVLAQKRDFSSLESLRKMEESARSWEMIYNVYSKMSIRDEELETANIKPPINSMVPKEEMNFARDKLCTGYIDIAEEKMQKNTRAGYQEAYNNWNKLLKYKCNYNDLDSMMNICIKMGKAVAALQIDVQQGIALPEKTNRELKSLSYTRNSKLGKWIVFIDEYELDQKIDYTVICTYNQITISENKQSIKLTEVKKQIIDRYESRKNAEGKIQKYPVYITAVATLKRITQKKNSTQGVYFEIMDNSKQTKLYQKQLIGKYEYSYIYTEASGDLRALSSDQKKLLKTKKRAYPVNSYMVEKSGKQLKIVIENEIYKQRNFLK